MKISPILILLYSALACCVEPFHLTSNFLPTIVVEGLITDEPGPYLVKITRAVAITAKAQLNNPVYESGAVVTIQDDLGNSETMTEKSPGNYYTSSSQGEIGRTYSISIRTADGMAFESASEKLVPVGDFKNLRFEFLQKEPPPPILSPWPFHQFRSANGFNVYLDSEILPEQEDRVWWRWTGTFKIKTYPELQQEYVSTEGHPSGAALVSDVDLCSGFLDVNRHTQFSALIPVALCTCCTCWITQYNGIPLLSNQHFTNNGKTTGINIAFIEANRRTFYEKYYLEVEQLSVSSAVYNFWKNVKIQLESGSNLFQTPPPKTPGNISASNSISIAVIGYFAASAVVRHSIVMTRADVPYDVGIIDTLKINCTKAYPYSSGTKPVFW